MKLKPQNKNLEKQTIQSEPINLNEPFNKQNTSKHYIMLTISFICCEMSIHS